MVDEVVLPSPEAVHAAAPDVTVVIPAYNAMPYFTRCIESVIGQSLGTDRLEIVVVDDGSTDGTGEEADRWARAHPGVVRVVHAEGSGGPAKPRNTGLEMAAGRYVFFLDADDYLGAEALQRLLTTADENGSDIVLGRMASTSDRSVPGSMFVRTDLDVDLFESRVYWTLAALKLFRRELLETNELRFPTHFPNCSDQPFTAMAYLRARKISVLSDYDYYFAELRDDGKHVTKSGSAANRLDVVETMCALLVREVPDADKRAPLLTRHFQIDLRRVVKAIAGNVRPEQETLTKRVTALVREHLSPEVNRRLTPDLRVVYDLAGREKLNEMLVAWEAARDEAPYDVSVEGDRVYAHLPYFRDASVGVPDDCYDITERIGVEHELTAYSWEGTTLRLSGTARFRRVIPGGDDTVEVLLRKRDEEPVEEYKVSARRFGDDGFEAELDVLTLAGGRPLNEGFWDVFVTLARGNGLSRSVRFGLRRTPEVSTTPSLRYAAPSGELWTATSYFTATGNLSVDIGQRKFKLAKAIHDWTIAWDGLELSASAVTDFEIHAPLALTLTGEGELQAFPAKASGDSVSARLPVEDVTEGQWAVHLRLGEPSADITYRLPAVPGLEAVKWRRRLLPWYALPIADRGNLVLRVAPVDVVRGAGRAVARLVRPGRS